MAPNQGPQPLGAAAPKLYRDAERTALYNLLATSFSLSLAEGLAATGRCAQGIALIDERIRLDEADQALSYMPELLRLRGSIFLSMPQRRVDDAETCFANSLDLSRRQGARAWELRTATDLAGLWRGLGKPEKARALLLPIFEQFAEGLETADLEAAKNVLASLR